MMWIPLFLFLFAPEPAKIEIAVNAPVSTIYCIQIEERVIPKNSVIETEPLVAPVTIVVDIIWLEGKKYRYKSAILVITPGYSYQIEFSLPEAHPLVLDC